MPSANSDSAYLALREGRLAETVSVSELTLKRDAGTLVLHSGRITFGAPVEEKVVLAVFSGDGEFSLEQATVSEREHLLRTTGQRRVNERFDRLVLWFTDDTYAEIKGQGQGTTLDDKAPEILRSFRDRIRRRTEDPRSMLEAMLHYETVENIEAEILGYLYNPNRPPTFNAFIFGKKFSDLRFLVRPYGAMPQLPSPEEVGLINFGPNDKSEGIWYLAHFAPEYQQRKASSAEDKKLVDARHYRIHTTLNDEKLEARAELTFQALVEGERLLSFGLLQDLRVSRVTLDEGVDVPFIQEKKDKDGSFYVILPEPLLKGQTRKVTVEYRGDKVLDDAGGGNFAVGARTSWYPSVNAFTDRATFDLTFVYSKKYLLVGVGKQVKEEREGDLIVSQWVSETPLAVAGFNYGRFKKKEVLDADTNYGIEGYATSALPDYLKGAEEIGGMSPTRLTENAIIDAQNSVRVFTHWFGPAPYGRIAITQQPEFSFGQSWPTLVYLPIVSFFDSTQRWQLLGGLDSSFSDFIQEVTPHEVAHQWWGHMVGWSSYRDQWISEGFSDFSAGLYLQATQPPEKYIRFWEQSRKAILERNRFGQTANDAGPIWMGLRLSSRTNPGAYSRLVYPKGGFILHMLRGMMTDSQTGDQEFRKMMQNFVTSHFNRNATTESFKKVVEDHMTSTMNLDGNGRMDWFFNQWVYGSEIPSYRFDYSLSPGESGKILLKATLAQSGVSPNFKMLVPLYLDLGERTILAGHIPIVGSTTTPEFSLSLPVHPRRVLINANQDILANEVVINEKK